MTDTFTFNSYFGVSLYLFYDTAFVIATPRDVWGSIAWFI